MPSFFRRAGGAVARVLASAVAPTPDPGEAMIYARTVDGVTQLFTKNSANVESQVTSPPSTVQNTITPAALGANQNNYTPTGLTSSTQVIRQDITTSVTLTGLAAQPAGTLLAIRNIKSAGVMEWITISHESASSTAANRFNLPSRNSWYIPPGGTIVFLYDGTLSRWVIWAFATNNFPAQDGDGSAGLTVGAPPEHLGLIRTGSLTLGLNAGGNGRVRVAATGADPNAFSYQSDTYFNALGQFRLASNANLGPLTGTVNDQAIASSTITARVSTSGATVITGFTGGAAGRVITIVNLGPDSVTLNSEDAGSTAANRILLSAATFVILANAACQLWYDTTSSRWRKLS